MKKVSSILLAAVLISFFSLSACDKRPVNRLVNPGVENGAVTWPVPWVLYADEIKTGGTVMSFTTQEGQLLDFASRDNPHSGSRCIKFSWDGSAVTQYVPLRREAFFVGFSLIVADTVDKYLATIKDISPGGYTKIKFWARGSLNSSVHLRLESSNGDSTSTYPNNAWESNSTDQVLTSNWQSFSFNVTGSLTSTLYFVNIVLKYDQATGQGNGGTVFLDDIELTNNVVN
jgi:hypothetical protein